MVVSRCLAIALTVALGGCQELTRIEQERRAMNDAQLAITAAASCDVAVGAVLRSPDRVAQAILALCRAYAESSGGDALATLIGR